MARKIQLTDELTRQFSRRKRKQTPRTVVSRILIVCEGEKTEPNYFRAFNKTNNGVFVVDLDFGGGGVNTVQVVDEAIRRKGIAEKKKMPYDIVWAVFDRDSFKAAKFNAAIEKADSCGIACAWSNETFELWYLLHFEYRNTGMSRSEYWNAIARHINETALYKKKTPYRYVKNDKGHYNQMTLYGSMDNAIDNAERLDKLYDNNRYAEHNPRTLVYKLVKQLLGRDDDFNRKVTDKLSEE